jgi:hypothetical protein
LAVRAAFVSLGGSLGAWCRARGYHQQNVRMALVGQWEGPRARAVRDEVLGYLREQGVSI